MKILILGKEKIGNNDSATQVINTIRSFCLELFGDEAVSYCEIPLISKKRFLMNLLFLQPFGYCREIKKQIQRSKNESFDCVLVLSSLFVGYVKKYFSQSKTVVFFQNVECTYYYHKFLSSKTIGNYLLYKYVLHNERLITKYGTYIHSFNHRDANEISKIYGRKVDLILPISFPSLKLEYLKSLIVDNANPYLLFIGSNFFANNDGITHFIRTILPHLVYQLVVVGSCCDYLKSQSDIISNPKVKLMGFVENFDSIIVNSSAIVCPIYSGSGMKTKTVEALRYAKSIVGTKEAFVGIDYDISKIGAECNSDEEFVIALQSMKFDKLNNHSFDLFEEQYSTNKTKADFSSFIEKVSKD